MEPIELKERNLNEIPLAKLDNVNKVVLWKPNITIRDLKSLQTSITRSELVVLKDGRSEEFKKIYTKRRVGFLDDKIVDGFNLRICKPTNYMVCVPSLQALAFCHDNATATLPEQYEDDTTIDWTNPELRYVLVPLHEDDHWSLLWFDIPERHYCRKYIFFFKLLYPN